MKLELLSSTDRRCPLGYEAEILADSVAPSGSRLTTYRLKYPRFIHSELMTHRTHSRNAGSSRAIPGHILRRQVIQHPANPVFWGRHQRGMQATEESTGFRRWVHQRLWYGARVPVVAAHWGLEKLGLHKQVLNRILEPWVWMESIWSATDNGWNNWFHLRAHKDAQPEFRHLAEMMLAAYRASKPQKLQAGEWHVPYGDKEDMVRQGNTPEKLAALKEGSFAGIRPFPSNPADVPVVDGDAPLKAAIGKIARVSFHAHDKKKAFEEHLALYEKLAKAEVESEPAHLSPMEHVAQALEADDYTTDMSGNFSAGWIQWRKMIERDPPRADPRRF